MAKPENIIVHGQINDKEELKISRLYAKIINMQMDALQLTSEQRTNLRKVINEEVKLMLVKK